MADAMLYSNDAVPDDELDLAEALADVLNEDPEFVNHADDCAECAETLDLAVEALVYENEVVEGEDDE